MTDRELLEYAAKAAGHSLGPDWDAGIDTVGLLVNGTGHGDGDYWNPLQDDGDALRLAVRLGIYICPIWHGENQTCARAFENTEDMEFLEDCVEEFNEDPYAATRRAIVRAAAEIGKPGATDVAG